VKQRQDHEARVKEHEAKLLEIQRLMEQDKQRHEADQMLKNMVSGQMDMMMQMMNMMKGMGPQLPQPPPPH